MTFYAHSNRRDDPSDWERLADHLDAVAALAELYGEPLGIAAAARLAGALHDLGKYAPAFQARLAGAKSPVDHSTAGAKSIMALAGKAEDRLVAALIAHAIAGHHAGLPDSRSADDSSLEARIKGFDEAGLDDAFREHVPETAAGLFPHFDWDLTSPLAPARQFAMLGRMIFSCLVDADFKATERYYESIGERRKDREWSTLADCLPAFLTWLRGEDRRFRSAAIGTGDAPRRDPVDRARARRDDARAVHAERPHRRRQDARLARLRARPCKAPRPSPDHLFDPVRGGVDRNSNIPASWRVGAGSPPTRGRGSKLKPGVLGCGYMRSPPTRGRGSKQR